MQGFLFLHINTNICYLLFFAVEIWIDARWYLTAFGFVFPGWLLMLNIFSHTSWLSVCLLETCLYRSFAHFFNFHAFGIESHSFQILTLYQMYGLKFSHFVSYLINFDDFLSLEASLLWPLRSHFIWTFRHSIQYHCYVMSRRFFLMFCWFKEFCGLRSFCR